MKALLYKLLAPMHRPRAIAALRKLERRLVSQRSRFAVPFAFRGPGLFRSIRPRQNPTEIESLYDRVCQLGPRRVLEIGTAKGGTLYLWAQAATDDAVIVSLDLPGGQFGGGYDDARTPLYQCFARPGQTLHLLRGSSHDPAMRQGVARLFRDQPIDFAFIDGDHTYEGVKADYVDYGRLVRSGGLIGFHDILPQPDSPETRVHQLWHEIKRQYEAWELIDQHERGSKVIGIGLIRVGDEGILPSSLSDRVVASK